MKVYIVFAYDQYYPCGDNIRGIYTNEANAERLAQEIRESDNFYDYVEVKQKSVNTQGEIE